MLFFFDGIQALQFALLEVPSLCVYCYKVLRQESPPCKSGMALIEFNSLTK